MKGLHKYTCKYCGKIDESKFNNKQYCSKYCIHAHWKETHQREYKGKQTEVICGNDNIKRDDPKSWLKYMRNNPEYYLDLGKFTNRFNQRRAE